MAARIGARSPGHAAGRAAQFDRHDDALLAADLGGEHRIRSLPQAIVGDAVNGRLDVFGVQLAAGDDHQVLDAAGHRELAGIHDPEVAGAQKWPTSVGEARGERGRGLRRPVPIAFGHARTVDPRSRLPCPRGRESAGRDRPRSPHGHRWHVRRSFGRAARAPASNPGPLRCLSFARSPSGLPRPIRNRGRTHLAGIRTARTRGRSARPCRPGRARHRRRRSPSSLDRVRGGEVHRSSRRNDRSRTADRR